MTLVSIVRHCRVIPFGLAALILAITPQHLRAQDTTSCYPEVDPSRIHYVVGFGSLMETASRQRTWPSTDTSLPITVQGFEHRWNGRGTNIGFSTTMLGVSDREGAHIVAALFRVLDLADFAAGDAREFSYCRIPVEPERITMLDGSNTPTDGLIWLYQVRPDHRHPPSADYPIIQSYVDIFLNGCFELAELVTAQDIDFVADCINTTSDWSTHWVNDRLHPRRPYLIPNALRIDELLHRMLPEEFAAIRIE